MSTVGVSPGWDHWCAGGQVGIPEKQRRLLWARSAGRCAICNRDLTRGDFTGVEFTLGEAAHIVGQKVAAGSPRGLLANLPEDQRDLAENLVLLCEQDHGEIDALEAIDVMTVDRLVFIKRRHEDHVRHVTGLDPARRTSVLRMLGRIRGDVVELDRSTAASAVLATGERFPRFDLSYDQQGLEIDLRDLPAEADGAPEYFEACRIAIDETIAHKVKDAIAQGEITHLSVFGFARIGPLVYLGSRLDDTVPIDVFQRHRSTDSWEWGDGSPSTFSLSLADAAEHEEAAIILNLSGSVHVEELPSELQSLPAFRITPTVTPHPDILSTRSSLVTLASTLRELFAELEAHAKHLRRLHVVGAIPLSGAITLGRVRDHAVHPPMVVYERDGGGYHPTIEIL
jgi:hypothetical protein